MEAVLVELRNIRRTQARILDLLEAHKPVSRWVSAREYRAATGRTEAQLRSLRLSGSTDVRKKDSGKYEYKICV